MSQPDLIVEHSNSIATITLNRPAAMNALSPQLIADLCAAFTTLKSDKSIRVVILTGNGRAFCAGLDLKALAESEKGLEAFALHGDNDLQATMAAFDRPIIVGVNGVAATGGFELALMGDILLASTLARFADTHCRVGLAPGWGLSQKLARIIGPSRAKEAHFTGNFISAEQAQNWGLVSRVVEPEMLLDECRKLAEDIASCVPSTVRVYKQLVDDGLGMSLSSGLLMERNIMGHANKGVSGDAIAARRNSVQQRGKTQAER